MTVPKIPPLDLSGEVETLWPELTAAIERVLRSQQFIMGPEVAAFEEEIAAWLGVKHAIGVNSGTDALVIALRALDIGPGDEVITTPFSFFATAESISILGATPVFVDVEEDSFNIDPTQIEIEITERTRAIMPVHLFGRPADMGRIVEIADRHGLKVVEDCAQSIGARCEGHMTGTIGAVGAFSFFPTKNLGAYGDGGLIATDDDDIADLARMLRSHGSKRKYHNEVLGYNSRLDSIQAAILRVKLPHLDAWNAQRREVAARYNEGLADVVDLIVPELVDGHVFHQYTVRTTGHDRDSVQKSLANAGVISMVYYPVPQDRLPVYAGHHTECRVSDRLSRDVLSLPIWPGMPQATQERVISALSGIV